jgi:hypothetical protein
MAHRKLDPGEFSLPAQNGGKDCSAAIASYGTVRLAIVDWRPFPLRNRWHVAEPDRRSPEKNLLLLFRHVAEVVGRFFKLARENGRGCCQSSISLPSSSLSDPRYGS